MGSCFSTPEKSKSRSKSRSKSTRRPKKRVVYGETRKQKADGTYVRGVVTKPNPDRVVLEAKEKRHRRKSSACRDGPSRSKGKSSARGQFVACPVVDSNDEANDRARGRDRYRRGSFSSDKAHHRKQSFRSGSKGKQPEGSHHRSKKGDGRPPRSKAIKDLEERQAGRKPPLPPTEDPWKLSSSSSSSPNSNPKTPEDEEGSKNLKGKGVMRLEAPLAPEASGYNNVLDEADVLDEAATWASVRAGAGSGKVAPMDEAAPEAEAAPVVKPAPVVKAPPVVEAGPVNAEAPLNADAPAEEEPPMAPEEDGFEGFKLKGKKNKKNKKGADNAD